MIEISMLHANIRKFFPESTEPPAMSLRSGDALDSYDSPIPFDAIADSPTDDYLNHYHNGLTYLDPFSWRHYLPLLMEYTLRHQLQDKGMVVEALLSSLRPPDGDPPRLGSLTAEQEQTICDFLDTLAFSEESLHKDYAMQVLEEYWVPNAIYRRS
jgi:hypothetical protein